MEFVEAWLPNTRDSFMNILQHKDGFEIPDAGKGVLEPLGDPGRPRNSVDRLQAHNVVFSSLAEAQSGPMDKGNDCAVESGSSTSGRGRLRCPSAGPMIILAVNCHGLARATTIRDLGVLIRWNFFSRSYVNPVGLAGGFCVAWK
ncbi:hypothetical protein TIFTF001_021827 [Ficus carica]|uniref:Uncharacterized protein n=1 Tax=Ficus carica TaxID=3494 RepID=A0AA88DJV8_FICCA|nr:hypothetical protein TIFTF001_021827 [Ficus carica]